MGHRADSDHQWMHFGNPVEVDVVAPHDVRWGRDELVEFAFDRHRLLRGGLQHPDLIGTVGRDSRTEELESLRLGGIARQVQRDELRRCVGGAVDPVGEAFTGDLAQPGVVVTLAVDAERVQLIGEVDIGVSLGRGGRYQGRRRDECSSQNTLSGTHADDCKPNSYMS